MITIVIPKLVTMMKVTVIALKGAVKKIIIAKGANKTTPVWY